jgi:guanylate kinase
MRSGKLIVLTGPSGVGKGTLVRSLLALHPDLFLSVSATTRNPRPGEIDGKDYYFVDRQQFESMIREEQLLEWAEYAGNYYGTLRSKIQEQIEDNKTVILEIELVGARAIRESFPDALRLFILPPSIEELENRLRQRNQDSPEAIERRLQRAQEEISAASEFDRQIVNDDFEAALGEIEEAIFK